jgi:hypothetical protein
VVNTRLLELSLMVWKYLLINNKGIFRTSAEGDIYEPPGGKGRRHVTYIEVNCHSN